MNSDLTDQAIEIFYTYFEGAIQSVAAIGTEEQSYSRQWKEIAYIVLLDTFSKFAFPQEKTNRKRFTRFVKEFTTWEHQSRVSLPHLVKLLSQSNDPQFDDVKIRSTTQLNKWTKGWVIYLDSDPCKEDLLTQWPELTDRDIKKRRILLDQLTHSELLYKRRNALVHEFKILGHAINFQTVNMPHYISMVLPSDGIKTIDVWSLGYPSKFLENLCLESLNNLIAYFRTNNINPQDMDSSDIYWIDTLSEK